MKIEKVNDRTIRCTLTKNDLNERQLKLSELAYGTEKARGFFKDMIQQASYQFGFEAEDIPLMIEAIPLSGEAIVLVITKVEDPDELDTRFSRFAPDLKEYGEFSQDNNNSALSNYGADEVIDLVKKLHDTIQTANKALKSDIASASASVPADREKVPITSTSQTNGEKNIQITVPVDIVKLYSFKDMNVIIDMAHILKGLYDGNNTLYRDPAEGRYYLVIRKSSLTPEVFNKVCNIITEYAFVENFSTAAQAFLNEHGEVLIPDNALQMLSEI